LCFNHQSMGFNPDMHNRRSIRLQEYDYSQNGYYYVTICTENFIKYFGEIKNGKMELSKIGEIVCDEWTKTEQIRQNVHLDEWVVMPNHFHAIVIIENDNVMSNVGAYCNTPLHGKNQFKSPSNNLGSIIRSFKFAVKRWCNKNGFEYFQWQRNYFERIIRNEIELYIKRRYIINNPIKWEFDKNNLGWIYFLTLANHFSAKCTNDSLSL